MSSKVLRYGGLAILAGGGYYLYKSQFDVKKAEQLAHADFHRASNAVQNKADELKGDKGAQWVGKQIDQGVADAKAKANETSSYFDQKAAEARAQVDKATEDAKAQYNKTTSDAKAQYNKLASDANAKVNEAGAKLQSGVDKVAADSKKAVSDGTSWLSGWFGKK